MKKVIVFLILIIYVFLYGCSVPTRYEREPNDIGFGNDDYKKSKCACTTFYQNGKWL